MLGDEIPQRTRRGQEERGRVAVASATDIFLRLSTSGSTGGGSERQSDVKDLPDMENLHLNDHSNKGSKAQVCWLVNVKACLGESVTAADHVTFKLTR